MIAEAVVEAEAHHEEDEEEEPKEAQKPSSYVLSIYPSNTSSH